MALKDSEQEPSTTPTSEFSGVVTSRKDRSIAWTVTIIFGVVILVPCLIGFVIKFGELVALTKAPEDGGFAITPVINYLLASAGFFFLLLWAALKLAMPVRWNTMNRFPSRRSRLASVLWSSIRGVMMMRRQ